MFFLVFPSFFLSFFCVWNGKPKKNIFLNGYDVSRSQKTKNKKLFVFFQHFWFGFLHWNLSKTFLVWFSAFSQKSLVCFFGFCLSFFCFSRFCLLFSMWPKLFELQVPSSGPAQRVSKYCFYNTRIYTIMVAADDRVTRGWSGQTKVLNQSLPLNNNALDIIITTQI